MISDNGEGVSVDGDHNTIGPGNTIAATTSPSTRASRSTAGSATRSRRTRSTATQGLGIDLERRKRHHAERPRRRRHGPERPAELPDARRARRPTARRSTSLTRSTRSRTPRTRSSSSPPTGCDASGNGEGAIYLGSRQVKLGGGPGNFSATLTGPDVADLNSDQSITATATDSNGSTSEFSACVSVTTANGSSGLSLTVRRAVGACGCSERAAQLGAAVAARRVRVLADPEQPDPELRGRRGADPELADPEQPDPEFADPEQPDPELADPELGPRRHSAGAARQRAALVDPGRLELDLRRAGSEGRRAGDGPDAARSLPGHGRADAVQQLEARPAAAAEHPAARRAVRLVPLRRHEAEVDSAVSRRTAGARPSASPPPARTST